TGLQRALGLTREEALQTDIALRLIGKTTDDYTAVILKPAATADQWDGRVPLVEPFFSLSPACSRRVLVDLDELGKPAVLAQPNGHRFTHAAANNAGPRRASAKACSTAPRSSRPSGG